MTAYTKAVAEHKDAAEQTRIDTAMAIRICHALSGTCVMVLRRKDHDACDRHNCAAMRAAFNSSGNA